MHRLILLRHGQSLWNKENRFTGWYDVDLSEQGVGEARAAGRLLRDEGFEFDVAYTSVLKRAIRTLWLFMEEMDCVWLPVVRAWELNEQGGDRRQAWRGPGEDLASQLRHPPSCSHHRRRALAGQRPALRRA